MPIHESKSPAVILLKMEFKYFLLFNLKFVFQLKKYKQNLIK